MPAPTITVHPQLNPAACFELVLNESVKNTESSRQYKPKTNWLLSLAMIISNSPLAQEELQKNDPEAIRELLVAKIKSNEECLSALAKLFGLLSGDFSDTAIAFDKDKKELVIAKILEGLSACPEGFADRIFAIWHLLNPRNKTLPERLQIIREEIVQIAASQLSGEVHAQNRVTIIAQQEMNLGIRPTNPDDRYPGNVNALNAIKQLQTSFDERYTPHLIVDKLEKQLLAELEGLGYCRDEKSGYTAAQWDAFLTHLKHLLPDIEDNLFCFFLTTDEDYTDPKINWPYIRTLLIEKLKKGKYFKQNTDLIIPPSPRRPKEIEYWAKLVRQQHRDRFETMDLTYVCAVVLSIKREPEDSDPPNLISTLLTKRTEKQLAQQRIEEQLEQQLTEEQLAQQRIEEQLAQQLTEARLTELMGHAITLCPQDASLIWDEVKKYVDKDGKHRLMAWLLQTKVPSPSFLLPDMKDYLEKIEDKTQWQKILSTFSLVDLSVDQMIILFELRNASGGLYSYSNDEEKYLKRILSKEDGFELQLFEKLPAPLKNMNSAQVCAVVRSIKRKLKDSDADADATCLISTLLAKRTEDQLKELMRHAITVWAQDASLIWDEVKKYVDKDGKHRLMAWLLQTKVPSPSFLLPDMEDYLEKIEDKTQWKKILSTFSLVDLSVDQMIILFELRNESGNLYSYSYSYSVEEKEYLEKNIAEKSGFQLFQKLPDPLKNMNSAQVCAVVRSIKRKLKDSDADADATCLISTLLAKRTEDQLKELMRHAITVWARDASLIWDEVKKYVDKARKHRLMAFLLEIDVYNSSKQIKSHVFLPDMKDYLATIKDKMQWQKILSTFSLEWLSVDQMIILFELRNASGGLYYYSVDEQQYLKRILSKGDGFELQLFEKLPASLKNMNLNHVCTFVLRTKKSNDTDGPGLISSLLGKLDEAQLIQLMRHTMTLCHKDASLIWDEVKKHVDKDGKRRLMARLLELPVAKNRQTKVPSPNFLLSDMKDYPATINDKKEEKKKWKKILSAFSLVDLSVGEMIILFELRNKSRQFYSYSVEEQQYLEKIIPRKDGCQLLEKMPERLKKIVATKENILAGMLSEDNKSERRDLLRRALSRHDPLYNFFAQRRGVLPTNPHVGTFAKIRSILDNLDKAADHLRSLANLSEGEEETTKWLWRRCLAFGLATFALSLTLLLVGSFVFSFSVCWPAMAILGIVVLVTLIQKLCYGFTSLINRCKSLPEDEDSLHGRANENTPPPTEQKTYGNSGENSHNSDQEDLSGPADDLGLAMITVV